MNSPLLGGGNDWVLRDVLGLADAEIASLSEAGAVEVPVASMPEGHR